MIKLFKEFLVYRREQRRKEAEGMEAVPMPEMKRKRAVDSDSIVEQNAAIGFSVIPATGGLILSVNHRTVETTSQYNSLKGSEPRNKLYLLHEDENTSERITQIVNMEILSR